MPMCAVSLLESREQRYIKAMNNNNNELFFLLLEMNVDFRVIPLNHSSRFSPVMNFFFLLHEMNVDLELYHLTTQPGFLL